MTTYEDRKRAKKAREWRAVDTLRALYPSLAETQFQDGVEGEEPDAVSVGRQPALGIEVVEYFTPASGRWRLKEREPLLGRILAAAEHECNQSGVTCVFAHVQFDSSSDIRKEDVPAMARKLVELLQPVSEQRLPQLRLYGARRVPRGISEVSAGYVAGQEKSTVRRMWGGLVPPVAETELLRLVAAKETKLQIYRKRCSEVWLLVVVDQSEPSSIGYIPPDYRLKASGFDRVVALQGFNYVIDLWPGVP